MGNRKTGRASSRTGNGGSIRVLHVSTTIVRGGAENHLIELIQGQVDEGLQVGCAYLKDHPYWAERLQSLDVPVWKLDMRFNGDPRALVRLRQSISAFAPHIVHAHGSPAEIYALAALSIGRAGRRFFISRHEERERLFVKPGFAKLDALLDAATDQFIAISGAVKMADIRRRPSMDAKTEVIHYGYSSPIRASDLPQQAAALRREWGVAEDAVLLGTLARMAPEKSLDTLIGGFARYLEEKPTSNVRLALVGRGPLEQDLRTLARQLGVHDKIVWAGFREDVPTVLEAFDIFMLTSSLEGFGLVLLEAMAAQRPIIASRTSAIPEIVEDGNTGLLFPTKDVEALSLAIGRLTADLAARRRMGTAGRERLEKHFKVSTMVSKTSALYRRALRDA